MAPLKPSILRGWCGVRPPSGTRCHSSLVRNVFNRSVSRELVCYFEQNKLKERLVNITNVLFILITLNKTRDPFVMDYIYIRESVRSHY